MAIIPVADMYSCDLEPLQVLFNFGIFLTLCFAKVCQKIFFGPLRAVEIEVSGSGLGKALH